MANVAQLIFSLTSGGASLADAKRLAQDRVLPELLGLEKGAGTRASGEPDTGIFVKNVLDRALKEFIP